MALKLWTGLVALGMGLVALLGLPPSTRWYGTPGERTPERVVASRLQAQLGSKVRRLQRFLLADSLSGVVLAAAGRGEPGVVGLPDWVGAETAGAFEAALQERLERLDDGPLRAAVGVFVVPRSLFAHPGVPSPGLRSAEYYVGVREGRPYCFGVLGVGGETPSALVRQGWTPAAVAEAGGPLGICRWYALYGLPGPEVGRWLEEGGLRFGSDAPLPEYPPETPDLFGLGMDDWWRSPDLRGQACLAGRPAACADVFVNGPLVEDFTSTLLASTPLTFVERRGLAEASFGGLETSLFSHLEAEFGPGRFADFWTSTAPPAEAFRDAFGVEPGGWTLEWARRYLEPRRAGPALDLLEVLSSLGVMLLAAGAAARLGRRRTVA